MPTCCCAQCIAVIFVFLALIGIVCSNILAVFRKQTTLLKTEKTLWVVKNYVPSTDTWISSWVRDSGCREYRISYMVSEGGIVLCGLCAFFGMIFLVARIASKKRRCMVSCCLGTCIGFAFLSVLACMVAQGLHWFVGFCGKSGDPTSAYPPLKDNSYEVGEGAICICATAVCLLIGWVFQSCA